MNLDNLLSSVKSQAMPPGMRPTNSPSMPASEGADKDSLVMSGLQQINRTITQLIGLLQTDDQSQPSTPPSPQTSPLLSGKP